MTGKKIKVFDPGIEWYADEIRSGVPFSFIRYGEGEWHVAVPSIKLKAVNARWKQAPRLVTEFQKTLLNHHEHNRYWQAIWHQSHLINQKYMARIKDYLAPVKPIEWHRGRVWRLAIERCQFHHIVKAIQKIELPLIFVGPKPMRAVEKHFSIAQFIQTDCRLAHLQCDQIEQQILEYGKPAFISFSAGITAKILIHRLFPKIGSHSYLVDFCAVWEGLCGHARRVYLEKMIKKNETNRNWGLE